jgi:lipopolysaccharide/colanic/teichoic acid biosynthesis glycosyltransferase
VVVCSVALLVLLPFLVGIALVVKLSSTGPVFFIQERIGRNGKPFWMVKFRTMTGVPARGLTSWSEAEEARVTAVGRLLRAYGIDELPQLVNIIRGEMSIIGPRPLLSTQVDSFTDSERRMLLMQPGVTNLAAVKGRYSISPEQRRKFHVEYVDRWSLGLDAAILLKTIGIVLGRRNAAEPPTRSDGR